MKAKELKYPFTWEERKVLIQDRILFVPGHYEHYEAFKFPGWNDPMVFGNHHPVSLEYCSGNGSWIVEKAQKNPMINWVAIEKRFDRVRKIWAKVKKSNLTNCFIICGEGKCATSHYFPDSSVQNVYINFPDPWPKKRHAKHRLITDDFAQDLRRVMQNKGTITFVTDDPDYSNEVIEVLQGQSGLQSIHDNPYYITDLDGYGTSFFDQLWREKGRMIRYHQYHKTGHINEN